MDVKMLDAQKHIDAESGCLCRYVRSDTEYFRLHYHNYYELFLVVKGEVCHIVNGKEQYLKEGQLLFIRDFDVHDYVRGNDDYFEFLNLAFSRETFRSLAEFLGEGFQTAPLLSAPYPPLVTLSPADKEKLSYALIELHRNSNKAQIRMNARALLTSVFTGYFRQYAEETSHIPSWLAVTYEKMKEPGNFIAGASRMYELSGRSREHLTRCMQQYYHTTPTALVTDLRLEYAANLLLISNLKATDICYECGFENLSWFYKVFSAKYQVTPAEYRRRYK